MTNIGIKVKDDYYDNYAGQYYDYRKKRRRRFSLMDPNYQAYGNDNYDNG